MAWRFWRDELLGDLIREGRQQVKVTDEKRQVHVIGNGVERHHLDGKNPPVLKEAPGAPYGKSSIPQPAHELALVDLAFPVGVEFRVEIIDVGFGFGSIHGKVSSSRRQSVDAVLRKRKILYC